MIDFEPITPGQLDERRLDYPTIARLQECQRRMARLVLESLGRAVRLEPLPIQDGHGAAPFASMLNAIERNTSLLAGADAPAGMLPTMAWRGGLHDPRRPGYQDVNRWFGSLQALRLHIRSLMPTEFETGAWQTGPHLELQMAGAL